MISGNSRFSIFFLLFSLIKLADAAAGTKDQSILLKGVAQIPLPDTTNYVSSFFIINQTPEIIAAAKLADDIDVFGNVIATSSLGKGKILVIGTDAYFENALLKDKDVIQLFKNIIGWGANNARKPKIGIFGDVGTGFKTVLKNQKASFYDLENFQVKKGTNLLVITQDVKDPVHQKALEYFIRNGGTLVFGSPYSKIYKSRNPADPASKEWLKINDLLAKAGLFNKYLIFKSTTRINSLVTEAFPDYLHFTTLMRSFSKPIRSPNFTEAIFSISIKPNLEFIFAHNHLDSPALSFIKKLFKIPDSPPVPSRTHPLEIKTYDQKWAYMLAHYFEEKKLDIHNNPHAKFASANSFPGEVPESALRVNEKIKISIKVGTQGLWDPASVYHRPHSTGFYIPAGEKVKIRISQPDTAQHLIAQIGVHRHDLMHLEKITREGFDLTRKFNLDKEITEVYSPYGGLLMINISDTTTIKEISLEIQGAVKAPFFKLGETTEEDWRKQIRNFPAPWAELATDKIIFTVPAYRIRNLDNPEKLLKLWDKVMDANADLAIISRKRVHPERMVIDNEAAFGYMFTSPYEMVGPDDENCANMLDDAFVLKTGLWGHFHEIGHRHQFHHLDFKALREVTVNLHTLYVYDQVLNKGLYNHEILPNKADVDKNILEYLSGNPDFKTFSDEPFIALCMYIQLIEAFGWEPIKAVNTKYRALPRELYAHKTDQEKIDLWFISISEATKSNLADFFNIWKVPVSEKAKNQVQSYQPWLPELLKKI